MRNFLTWDELGHCVGQDIGWSDWLTVTQAQIDGFAQATGDHQWIHVDPERAAQGPFGATIAHGFLTLALLPHFFSTTYTVQTPSMGVNYGLNKVRFMAPVWVHSRLRALLHLLAFEKIAEDALQLTWQVSVACEGQDKPVCVAQYLVRRYSPTAN
jgi:acyl dehydratase